MSMHKVPLSKLEEEGLKLHGLSVGKPNQLSDAFRQGVAWALSQQAEPVCPFCGEPSDHCNQSFPHPSKSVPAHEEREMTADRAANLMRRFKSEEKMLGPNEQAAIDYVLELLADRPAQKVDFINTAEQQAAGWKLVPVVPTQDMIDAAMAGAGCDLPYPDACDAITASIAAAPHRAGG